MSLENLTYAEAYYYAHSPDYHQAVRECLKSMGIPLRIPAVDGQSTIDSFVTTMNRVKGFAPGKVRKLWGRKQRQSYEEMHG